MIEDNVCRGLIRMDDLFIVSTEKNIGKTYVSLGLINLLAHNGYKVGYFKPISHKRYWNNEKLRSLLGHLQINDDIQTINPVCIDNETTRNLDECNNIKDRILEAYIKLKKGKDILIIEGVGSSGVGSIIGCSNADLANFFDINPILIAPAGIGYTIDSICTHQAFYGFHHRDLKGVIVNRIIPEKYEHIKSQLEMHFMRFDINCLGYLMDLPKSNILDMRSFIRDFLGVLVDTSDVINIENCNLNKNTVLLDGHRLYEKLPVKKHLIILKSIQEYTHLKELLELNADQCLVIICGRAIKGIFDIGNNIVVSISQNYDCFVTRLKDEYFKFEYSFEDIAYFSNSINQGLMIDDFISQKKYTNVTGDLVC